MIEQISAWWRARTPRERRLVQGAGVFIFAILLPLWGYFAAAQFRNDAADALVGARRVETQVAQIVASSAQQGALTSDGDASVRGRALAAAQAVSLVAARVEPSGPDGVRIAFEPADSLAVYRFIDQVGRRGAHVTRTSIVRVAETDLVTAEFEIAAAP